MREKIILGVIGGMGHEATICFQTYLMDAMRSYLRPKRDQDYYRVIVDNNSHIPDRNAAFFDCDNDVIGSIKESVEMLERYGASLITIPCNTAHIFLDKLKRHSGTPIVHMIKETADYVTKRYIGLKKVGLISTLALKNSKLYDETFLSRGVEVIKLETNLAQKIHNAVFDIKSNTNHKDTELACRLAINFFQDNGVQAVILGCTEFSLLDLWKLLPEIAMVDPMKILAMRTIEYAIALENDFAQ
jgi:aspartate racemase